MWKSASASGSPWSRFTALSLDIVSSGETVRSSPVSPKRPVSAVKSGVGCCPVSSTTIDSLLRLLRMALSRAAESFRSETCVSSNTEPRSFSEPPELFLRLRQATNTSARMMASSTPSGTCQLSSIQSSQEPDAAGVAATGFFATGGCAGGGVGVAVTSGGGGAVACGGGTVAGGGGVACVAVAGGGGFATTGGGGGGSG